MDYVELFCLKFKLGITGVCLSIRGAYEIIGLIKGVGLIWGGGGVVIEGGRGLLNISKS